VTLRLEEQVLNEQSVDLTESLRDLSTYLLELPYDSSSTYSIGSHLIQFQFGLADLKERICQAFEHLIVDPCVPARLRIAIHTYDSAPRVRLLDRNLRSTNDVETNVWLLNDSRRTYILQRNGQVLCGIDWHENRAWWFTAYATTIPYLERAAPLRQLLSLWLAEHGIFLIHAAAVGTDRGGAIILGSGGSGKSSTSIECMLGGMRFAADDHCLLDLSRSPKVHSLYGTAKLAVADVDRFPVLHSAPGLDGRPPGEKCVFLLNDVAHVNLQRELPLRRILLARIAHQPITQLRRVTEAEAFKVLAPSCALHFPAQRLKALRCFSAVIRQIPSYLLELGHDFENIPDAICKVLEENDPWTKEKRTN
jgi:hypothetical protein